MKQTSRPGEPVAHTPNEQDEWHDLKEHLEEVAGLAETFSGGTLACLAGLWHGLGKFDFQEYLWAAHNVRDFTVPQAKILLQTAGLLHDLGKYKLEFQLERLGYDPETGRQIPTRGKRVDHSSLEAVMNCPDPQNSSLTPSTNDEEEVVS